MSGSAVACVAFLTIATGARGQEAAFAGTPPELDKARIGCLWNFDSTNTAGWHAVSNISEMRTSGGVMSVQSRGADPYIVGPRIELEAAAFPHVALRCRSNVEGVTQIFYETHATAGFREEQMVPIAMHGDNQFHVYEIDMRALPQWKGTIARLRVDPVNGVSESVARVDIDWIAAYQAPARILPLLPHWKDASTLSLGFSNVGGRPTESEIELHANNLVVGCIPALDCFGASEVNIDASYLAPHFWIEAVLDGELMWRGRMVRPCGNEALTDPTRQDTPPRAKIAVSCGAGMLSLNEVMRVDLAPVASLTLRGPGSVVTYYQFDPVPISTSGDESVYEDRIHDPLVSDVVCTTRIRGTEVRTTLEACSQLEILRFEGPRMLQTRPHTHAVFPGLEYLEAGEESSDSKWTGVAHAARTTPARYKISAPMIAVEYDRTSTPSRAGQQAWVAALTWDAKDCAESEVPVAEFSSRSSGLSYATTFLPARPVDEEVDERLARRPLSLPANQPLEVRSRFWIGAGTIEDVFADHWLPKAPRPPPLGWITPSEHHAEAKREGPGSREALEHIVQTSMLAYTKTMFDPNLPGWKSHIAIQEKHTARRELGAFVLAESLRSNLPELAHAINVPLTETIEDRIGTAAFLVNPDHRKRACDVLGSMSADGGIGYSTTPAMAKTITDLTSFHGTSGDALGERGATNSGLIAENAMVMLEYAAVTRDLIFVTAAERALERMNSFTVPRGSQTWEIHADTPDLYAAAQCARANLWGYRITGDEKYLDEAERWLKTGLPFLYWWDPVCRRNVEAVHVADELGEGTVLMSRDPQLFHGDTAREVLPFGSLPVFGTSWYAVTWFGIPVQWCGLAWGNAVRELDEIRPVPRLIQVADGVFRSGANQQADKGYLAGTLPDSWEVATGLSRQPYIIPNRLLEYAYRCLGVPHMELTRYVRLDDSRWTHATSRAVLSNVVRDDTQVQLTARFIKDQNASVLIGGTRGELPQVSINGRTLTKGDGIWQQHWIDCGGDRGVLCVRWVATGQEDHIEIASERADEEITRASRNAGLNR